MTRMRDGAWLRHILHGRPYGSCGFWCKLDALIGCRLDVVCRWSEESHHAD